MRPARLHIVDGTYELFRAHYAKRPPHQAPAGWDAKATVGVVELDSKHAFANIALTDNVVRFATRRYCDNPLIVQGPGAGPEVTAGGVFADLLRLAAYLGARL